MVWTFLITVYTIFCTVGSDYEGLSAQERGGDVQVCPGGGGAVGYYGVLARGSTNQHRF